MAATLRARYLEGMTGSESDRSRDGPHAEEGTVRKGTALTAVIAAMVMAASIWHVADVGGHPARASIVAAVSMAGPVTVLIVRRRRARRGVDVRERALTAEVQSLVLRDTLVVLTVAILVGLLRPAISAALMACVVLLVALADSWLRYFRALRALRALPAGARS
jgi:Kef-type K+ transport system membrane component KefB